MTSVLSLAWDPVAGLFDRGFDPARGRNLPLKSEPGESNVKGMYLAGEIAGTPLIKLGLNRGRDTVTPWSRCLRGILLFCGLPLFLGGLF